MEPGRNDLATEHLQPKTLNLNQVKEQLEKCSSNKDLTRYKAIFKSAIRRGIKANNRKDLAQLLPYFNRPEIFTDDDEDCFSLVFEGIRTIVNDPQWLDSFRECDDTLFTFLDFMKIEEVEESINSLLPKARAGSHKDVEAHLLLVLGNVCKLRHNYQLSLLYLKQCLRLLGPNVKSASHTTLLIEIGTIHRLLRNYDTALDYFEQAKAQSQSGELHSHYVSAMEMEALLFMDAGDLISAEGNFRDSFSYGSQHPNSMSVFTLVWHSLFNIEKEAYEEAITILQSFLDNGIHRFNPILHLHVLKGLGAAYCGLGQYSKAIEYLWRAHDLIQPRYMECMEMYIQLLDVLNEVLYSIYNGEYFDELSRLLTNVKLMDNSGLYSNYMEQVIVSVELTKIDRLLDRIRKEETYVIYIKNYQVDMNSGDIARKGKHLSQLTPIQMGVFRLMYEKRGSAVSNEDIVKCSDYYYKDKTETPRRSHYYISQMRKRFDDYSLFEAVRGIGYRLRM